MKKNILFWLFAILITLSASVFQRVTGPTYPKTATVELNGRSVKYKFPRSGGEKDCLIPFHHLSSDVKPQVFWKEFPSDEPFKLTEMLLIHNQWNAVLPVQPPAGKIVYYVHIGDKEYFKDNPLVIRFKGDVSPEVLVPHIFFLFLAMLLSSYALMHALFDKKKIFVRYIRLTFICLIIGGFIFGPLVQYQSFGQYWTGIPFGYDLTDNKVLFAFVFVLLAVLTASKKYARVTTIIAVISLYLIFCIPHSLGGSELNRSSGQIETGVK